MRRGSRVHPSSPILAFWGLDVAAHLRRPSDHAQLQLPSSPLPVPSPQPISRLWGGRRSL